MLDKKNARLLLIIKIKICTLIILLHFTTKKFFFKQTPFIFTNDLFMISMNHFGALDDFYLIFDDFMPYSSRRYEWNLKLKVHTIRFMRPCVTFLYRKCRISVIVCNKLHKKMHRMHIRIECIKQISFLSFQQIFFYIRCFVVHTYIHNWSLQHFSQDY